MIPIQFPISFFLAKMGIVVNEVEKNGIVLFAMCAIRSHLTEQTEQTVITEN